MEGEPKKRNPRTTKKQIEIITNFLEMNPVLISGAISARDMNKIDEKWLELTNELNNSGVGPMKTVKQWKNAVKELKTNVKKRAREINLANIGTGGGPRKVKELTELEEKLLGLISKVVIEGIPEIPEPGILVANEIEKELQETIILNEKNDLVNNVVFEIENTPSFQTVTTSDNAKNSTIQKVTPPRIKRRRQHDPYIKNTSLIKGLQDQSKAMNNLADSINNLAKTLDKIAEKYN